MYSLQKFRTYELSVQFYRDCKGAKVPYFLRDQLLRAASSVSLNLSEGSAKPTRKDRLKFYFIAFGSLRECQAIIKLESLDSLAPCADQLAAMLYRLTQH